MSKKTDLGYGITARFSAGVMILEKTDKDGKVEIEFGFESLAELARFLQRLRETGE